MNLVRVKIELHRYMYEDHSKIMHGTNVFLIGFNLNSEHRIFKRSTSYVITPSSTTKHH